MKFVTFEDFDKFRFSDLIYIIIYNLQLNFCADEKKTYFFTRAIIYKMCHKKDKSITLTEIYFCLKSILE